jgi:hypothetical protein
MIGKTFQRYKVVSNTNNRVILAHNPKACEPWVVWWVDYDGDPYGGSYFSSRDAAVNEFISRSF